MFKWKKYLNRVSLYDFKYSVVYIGKWFQGNQDNISGWNRTNFQNLLGDILIADILPTGRWKIKRLFFHQKGMTMAI